MQWHRLGIAMFPMSYRKFDDGFESTVPELVIYVGLTVVAHH